MRVGAVVGVRRMMAVAAVTIAAGLLPAVAHAQVFGSLAQLARPNNCIESTDSESSDCRTTAPGLDDATDDVAVSPDGKNVYVISTDDESIAEFTRNADGSLAELGCIASNSDSGSTCSNKTAIGLDDPQAIAISPDGMNVYVAVADDGSGDVAEFTRNADGSLTPIANNGCIAEQDSGLCPTNDNDAHGLESPDALAVSPDGDNVYVGDSDAEAITTLTRSGVDGSLSQPGGAADCIQDPEEESNECSSSADGLSDVTGVAVSPDGDNVYTSGSQNEEDNGSIAEFSRGAGGALSPIGCVGTPEGDDNACGDPTATGVTGIIGLVVSPDGENVYTASQEDDGPISEFSRGAGGVLQQLSPPNNCIQEPDSGFNCATGTGIGSGDRLAISPDGADVYAAAPGEECDDGTCSDVAEFARNTDAEGALTQLASPDGCIQETGIDGSDCTGNETGTGLGGAGVAVSPDNASVYVTGQDGVAEFARAIPTLTVSLAGPGSGGVSDGTGAISCQPTCSHAYGIGQVVTLTATPAFGSAFSGWSGGNCSGTGICQVVVSADTAVTATFAIASGAPGVSPGPPVVTGPSGAGLSGSVNPEGFGTSAFFEYGIDLSQRGPGSSTVLYNQTTPVQQVGSDFSQHAVSASLSGLVPNATYHVRLVATNSAGTVTGPDQTFTTAKNAPPPPPVLGKSVNVSVVSGQVFILPPPGHTLGGASDRGALSKGTGFMPLTEARQIPTGSEIDALHGALKLVSNTGNVGKTQTATLTGGVYRLTQVRKGITKGLTTFKLLESAFKGGPSFGVCKAKKSADEATIAKLSTKTLQLLKVSGHGKYKTTGRYSSATVRGTIYTVADKCNGTLTHVIRDTVLVDDFARHKKILLHAGQSYLAKKP